MKSNLIQLFCILALAGVAGYVAMNAKSTPSSGVSTSEPRSAAPDPASRTGSLKGVVKYDGDPPAPRMIEIGEKVPRAPDETPEQAKARKLKTARDESLLVDPKTKEMQWAVVRIMNATPTDAPPKPATALTIDQKGFNYSPRILIVPPKTDVQILNPDKVLNNFHSMPYDSANPAANFVINPDSARETYKAEWLALPDLVEFKSDIYPWMQGFFVVHDPRYCAVTGADGTFEIKDLPPGKYKVNVWHERFGNYLKKETIDVEVKAGAATDLGELKFSPS